MMGDQSRHAPETRIASPTIIASVTAATTGPAAAGAPSAVSCTRSSATGRTETAISISTVPETTGVIIRLSSGSHKASAR